MNNYKSKKVISRCGLICSDCEYREKMNCPTCHAANGKMFWGKCRVAKCSIEKNIENCSECENFPCALLKKFSFDEKQGDDGERIDMLKKLRSN